MRFATLNTSYIQGNQIKWSEHGEKKVNCHSGHRSHEESTSEAETFMEG